MLLQLITFGIVPEVGEIPGGGSATGPVTAKANRTAVMQAVPTTAQLGSGIPLGAVVWLQPFDPADRVPFAIDFTALLDDDEKIVLIDEIAMSAAGALLGVGVDTEADYSPIIDTAGKKVQLWFGVTEAYWNSSSFASLGISVPVTVRIITDASPPKRFERSGVLTVRQL